MFAVSEYLQGRWQFELVVSSGWASTRSSIKTERAHPNSETERDLCQERLDRYTKQRLIPLVF
jgi:hypothetical protein